MCVLVLFSYLDSCILPQFNRLTVVDSGECRILTPWLCRLPSVDHTIVALSVSPLNSNPNCNNKHLNMFNRSLYYHSLTTSGWFDSGSKQDPTLNPKKVALSVSPLNSNPNCNNKHLNMFNRSLYYHSLTTSGWFDSGSKQDPTLNPKKGALRLLNL